MGVVRQSLHKIEKVLGYIEEKVAQLVAEEEIEEHEAKVLDEFRALYQDLKEKFDTMIQTNIVEHLYEVQVDSLKLLNKTMNDPLMHTLLRHQFDNLIVNPVDHERRLRALREREVQDHHNRNFDDMGVQIQERIDQVKQELTQQHTRAMELLQREHAQRESQHEDLIRDLEEQLEDTHENFRRQIDTLNQEKYQLEENHAEIEIDLSYFKNEKATLQKKLYDVQNNK